jgi:hypothetical protein
LKETLGADGYYEYCIARMKNAHKSLEFKYIKEFFTNGDYWGGGVAVSHPLLKKLLAAKDEERRVKEAEEKERRQLKRQLEEADKAVADWAVWKKSKEKHTVAEWNAVTYGGTVASWELKLQQQQLQRAIHRGRCQQR